MAEKQASEKTQSPRVFGQARKSGIKFHRGLYARISTNDQQTIPLQPPERMRLASVLANAGWDTMMSRMRRKKSNWRKVDLNTYNHWGQILRKRYSCDLLDSTITVVLVHGTFSRRAAWTQEGSPLRNSIAKAFDGRVSFSSFCWSGANSGDDRDEAATALSVHLDHLRAAEPTTIIVVIAHSHGGNVGIRAISRQTLKPADGVVCLGTPALFAQRRSIFPLVMLLQLRVMLTTTLLAVWVTGYLSEGWLRSIAVAVGLVATLPTAISLSTWTACTADWSLRLNKDAIVGLRRPYSRILRAISGMQRRRLRRFSDLERDLQSTFILCLRSSIDEAFLALTAFDRLTDTASHSWTVGKWISFAGYRLKRLTGAAFVAIAFTTVALASPHVTLAHLLVTTIICAFAPLAMLAIGVAFLVFTNFASIMISCLCRWHKQLIIIDAKLVNTKKATPMASIAKGAKAQIIVVTSRWASVT